MAIGQKAGTVVTDGSLDWSSGVNSTVATTIQSTDNPNGLKRTALAWMDNCTVRDGGITQRFGWSYLGTVPAVATYQGSFIYVPDTANPYHIVVIGGHVYQVDSDNPDSAVDLSVAFNLVLPLTERVYFVQAEIFLVIQAGDGVTLPLIWDGTTLRQSKGITDPNATTSSPPHTNEIPAATAMCYYMGRLWYAQGRAYSAGDIVGGASGTLAYGFRDSVLCVQENPLCVGGDGFVVPTNAGNIRGIAYQSNINSQLGEGALYIGTREQIYQLTVPTTRTDWIAATTNNMPLQTVALSTNGWVNDRSIVTVNGDLFFQCLEPSIRSLTTAVRNFQQWGNVPISVNEQRVLQFVDRSLLRFASGIYFDNRMLQTTLPFNTPVGVAHKAIIPLNFDVISTLEQQLPPVWEGMLEGVNILELTQADYGGRPRAFATVWSETKGTIELWELTNAARFDTSAVQDNRVTWYFETPAFTWGDEFAMKKMVGGEIWYDKLIGEAVFNVQYRPDGDVCWHDWVQFRCCTEGFQDPTVQYPETARESYRQMQSLPVPPASCTAAMARPSNQGFQMQVRLTVHGYCRIRGLYLFGEPMLRKLYDNLVQP
jgi:hypothetical protein